jgi:hypothetical protein
MLPNVIPNPACRSETIGRDESLCGVNSKDPNRIDFSELGDEGAGDNASDADEVVDEMTEAADNEPCANRVPTDGAN